MFTKNSLVLKVQN